MLYTFSQFQKIKQEIRQEFNSKPPIDVHHFEWDEGFNDYRKILNDLKAQKYKKKRNCQSASRIHHNSNTKRPQTHKKFQNISTQITNFYLTQILGDESRGKHIKQQQMNITEENDELLNIIIRLTQCGDISKNLKVEIKELENQIRFYRKNNHQMQWKLKQQQKKENVVFNCLLKKKNELINFQNKSRQFKEKVHHTERFFGRSLKSIQNNAKKNQQKATEMMEQVAQAILIKQKLKIKSKNQQQTLDLLQNKMLHRQYKIKEMKNLFERAKSLIYSNQISLFIRKYGYNHIDQINELCNRSTDKNIYNSNQIVQIIQGTNILKVGRDMLKVFKKMKSDEQRLKQMYQFKIMQRKQKQQQLANIISMKNKYSFEDQKNYNSNLMNINQERQMQLIKQTQSKLKRLCDMLQSLQERGKFFIKKLIKFLIMIIQNWLQYDQQAISFVMNIIQSYSQTIMHPCTVSSSEQIKKILIKYFENWPKYLFFAEQAAKFPMVCRNLNKKRLANLFHRIIKSKIHKPSLHTQDLFFASLNILFNNNLTENFLNIQKLLKSFQQIYIYASKYQVLVVNKRDPQVKFFPMVKSKTKLLYPLSKKQQRMLQLDEQNHEIQQNQKQTQQNECSQTWIKEDHPELTQYILSYQQQIKIVSKLNKKNKNNDSNLQRALKLDNKSKKMQICDIQ